jgi:putative phage-type endonuclease
MGLLKHYYDKIVFDQFKLLNQETNEYLLKEWDGSASTIKNTEFYEKVSSEILKTFGILYEDDLPMEIWRVIRSLRRIILNPTEIHEQMNILCKINETLPAQRSPAWHAFRENLLTASSWGNILGYIGSRKDVILQKCGYEPAQFKGNKYTRWGVKYESIVIRIYEKRTGKNIIDFGCMRHSSPDNFFLGASPDGISADGGMLEAKVPQLRNIGSIPTDYYMAQMWGQLEVCNLEICYFLECKIHEFNTVEEYMDHVHQVENGSITENIECGVSVDFFIDADTVKTIHSDFFIKDDSIDKFISDRIDENNGIKFIGVTYWKIEIYQCNPVFRNREWFAWAREHLKIFYDELQFYRKVGYKSLLTERQYKPKKDDMEDTKITDYDGFQKKSAKPRYSFD